jgi:hypothetical protein
MVKTLELSSTSRIKFIIRIDIVILKKYVIEIIITFLVGIGVGATVGAVGTGVGALEGWLVYTTYDGPRINANKSCANDLLVLVFI